MFKFLIVFFLFPIGAICQISKNVELLDNWKRDGLETVDNQRFNDIWAWADSQGREFAVMGGLDSIYFFDVTDPYNIVLCDVEPGKDRRCIHRDFKTYKNYCYAVADEGNSSLQIFDVSYLPDSVHKVYDNDTFSVRTHNIFIDNDKLYLAANRNRIEFQPMRVLSLKNPIKPTQLVTLEAPWVNDKPLFRETHDVFVRNDTAYCSNGDDGFFIYIYNDSSVVDNDGVKETIYNPNLKLMQGGVLTRYPTAGYNHSSWLSEDGKVLVFADEDKGSLLKVYSINSNSLELESTFSSNADLGSMPHNPMLKDGIVYISYYEEGMQVFDIRNPSEPKQIAYYDTYPDNGVNYPGYEGCWGVYPFLPSGNILASDQMHGLFVFRVDIPSSNNTIQKQNLSVYPNPSTGTVRVDLPLNEQVEMISLYDLKGQLIWEQKHIGNDNYYDLKADLFPLSQSIFLLKLSTKQGNYISKLQRW